jgi:hypothetical protein
MEYFLRQKYILGMVMVVNLTEIIKARHHQKVINVSGQRVRIM